MNTSQLKTYAPGARKAFIEAVSAQAARLGITAKNIAPAEVKGDVLLVEGKALPRAIAEPRRRLADRIRAQGFGPTMEAFAYTWFNRFVAIRYMELHGYLNHGYRVLSHPEGLGRPEMLDHATDVDLPGLDREKVVELKLDGTKDEELYRLLFKAQCNALHEAMPFLFERIGDETELLLPANLLHTDSLIRKLVEEIDEEAWEQIEIIGWLYQFYISEKKDEVIGKVVKSEDIPAATQLFTPNWIVKYMVQNSLGAQWLATYPNSPLKGEMEYYIEPAEQTDEVQAQLDAITPDSLDPEELTLIDPACGSGHILVEAYDLFKAIYLERGYRQRDVAKLILEKNLLGLEICDRAAQLTGFALMMKGRADDRWLFERRVKLNVLAFQNSDQFDVERLADGVELSDYNLEESDLRDLKELFDHATTYGSLIQVPEALAEKLPEFKQLSEVGSTDVFVADAMERLKPLVWQTELLAAQYDAIVANPPYMGGKGMNRLLRDFAGEHFPAGKADLFSMFILRSAVLTRRGGYIGFVCPFVWMFIPTYAGFRSTLLSESSLISLIQLEYNAFEPACVPVATFVGLTEAIKDLRGDFIQLSEFKGSENQGPRTLEAIRDPGCAWRFGASTSQFLRIPDAPIAYWLSSDALRAFELESVGDRASVRKGMYTSDNARFVRNWTEVSWDSIGISMTRDEASISDARWFPYANGGYFRKWFGNLYDVVLWENDGYTLRHTVDDSGNVRAGAFNLDFIFKPGICWTTLSSSFFAARYLPKGMLFSSASSSLFPVNPQGSPLLLGILNSTASDYLLKAINPTLNYNAGDIAKIPVPILSPKHANELLSNVEEVVSLYHADWANSEDSWEFTRPGLLPSRGAGEVRVSLADLQGSRDRAFHKAKTREEVINRLVAEALGLLKTIDSQIGNNQVSLGRFDKQTEVLALFSYAIGCMMGRYSLDEPGLIYAHSGNKGFDPSRYETFPADDDGIIPITHTDWFDDDAVHRTVEFLSVAWDPEHLEENLTFLADNLSPRKNESSRETLRRYLCNSFFKDHLQTYKKRPIYWLFSSGKQKAFQCLVYLHRYHEGTLARMRSEYVIPLQGKIAARIEQLAGDIEGATSATHRKRLEKERDKLEKQQVELLAFDEKLRHYADKRIKLDLDEGVKVNYGKFGDLLAEVKKVHGKKATDA